jgi:penicillin-binding protein 1A
MGAYAQGGRIAAPVWKEWAQTALKDQSKVPFVAPPGIRWVRIDRATGKRVYGVFPTTEDAKSSVIWEAFQPQTEPRRSYRGATGDPYGQDGAEPSRPATQHQAVKPRTAARARAIPPPAAAAQPAGLPTQNGV